MFHRTRSSSLILFLILSIALLAGCAHTTPEPTAIPTALTETPTPQPTETLPAIPTNLVTVGLETWDPGQQGDIRSALQNIAASAGLTVVEKNAADIATASSDAKGIVVFVETPNILDLAAAAPESRFVYITNTQQSTATNLAIIRLPETQQAFLAGYLSTVISPDFRSAGLFRADDQVGYNQVYAFQNGGGYYCGTCYPYYAPLVQFPLVGYQPAGADTTTWQTIANELIKNVVYTMYFDEYASDPVLLSDLASKGVMLTGKRTPPDTVRSMWAATIGFDLVTPLQTLSGFMTGTQETSEITAPLLVRDINENLFSAGKQANVANIQKALEAGLISPDNP
jgi:hypothetical protein